MSIQNKTTTSAFILNINFNFFFLSFFSQKAIKFSVNFSFKSSSRILTGPWFPTPLELPNVCE